MAEKAIPYIVRDYQGCRQAILDNMRKYYPDVFGSIDDASIGQWLVDIMADIYDNLNFHIDRLYQETSLTSAQQTSSLLNMAKTNGMKVPGKKSALCEVEISCDIPTKDKENGIEMGANENYCPIIKRGTLFSTGLVTFELQEDVNFAEQFNSEGVSDRQMIPNRDSNGNIISYTYKKLAIVSAGQSKIYKRVLSSSDIEPFMNITIQDADIIGVESIILKPGTNLANDPDIAEFYVDNETFYAKNGKTKITRFFEVDSLVDQYRFGYAEQYSRNDYYNPIWESATELPMVEDVDTGEAYTPVRVTKGFWKRLKHKFITEYSNTGNLIVTFGGGYEDNAGMIPTGTSAQFTQYLMSKMKANDAMGVLPEAGNTLYILYRVGGGEISNIAKGTLTNIIYLSMETKNGPNMDPVKLRQVRTSLKVTNTTPSYGGKDAPTANELRYMLKYNGSAQRRCTTIHDYQARLMEMPAKYGIPFRTGVVEENNKIVIYTLGLDSQGYLTNTLSETVAQNMKEYLSMYRAINDFVEIKSGKVVNVKFNLTIYVDKTFDKAEVVKRVIDTVYDYMDIRKHQMGEDIYLGDLQREVSHLDGVLNLVSLKCYNMTGEEEGYSEDEITQEVVQNADCCNADEDYTNDNPNMSEIDLKYSDYILFSDANSMFEIKYKDSDIIVTVKTR